MKRILKLCEQKDDREAIENANSIFDQIKEIDIDYDQENFLIFYLNTKNKLLNCEVLFKGTMNSCLIDPKIIFKKTLLNKAIGIIVAHNHPSEDLTPSEEDVVMAIRLKEIGEFLDIDVLDNIIFNKKEYYSLKEAGLLD